MVFPLQETKYTPFIPAQETATCEIDEYYEKTTESPAYIMSMYSKSFFLHLKVLCHA